MLPTTVKNTAQRERIDQIAPKMHPYDIVVFSEAFDDDLRTRLIDSMKIKFPHFTCILGHYGNCIEGDKAVCQDGGVIIFSKYPIIEQDQKIYYRSDCDYGLGLNDILERYQRQECWGSDCQAKKGVLYAKINKHGSNYHVFGTHTQASYSSDNKYRRARELQFSALNTFINGKSISSSEPIIIAGDLNVDKLAAPDEYIRMLEIFNTIYPNQIGENYTYNPTNNCLAEGKRVEYLDYILYKRNHKLPINSTIETILLKAELPYIRNNNQCNALSDHYPVISNAHF